MTSLRAWFRPPRHLLAIFLAITLVPSALFIGFGWRLLEQDGALALGRIHERQEQTADLAVAGLQQSLSEVERQLRGNPFGLPQSEDAVALVFRPRSVEGKLLYYPVAGTAKEAPSGVFAAAEHAEYSQRDPAKAEALLRELAGSPDSAIRAGAWIRLARVLRNNGQPAAALAAYGDAARLDGPAVSGLPVSLLAAWATCDLLSALHRREELRREAGVLHADLLSGRWQLDRAAWQSNLEDARRWLGDADPPQPSRRAMALAAGAEWLWNKWGAMPHSASEASGRESVVIEGRSLTILWLGDSSQLRAWLAGPDFANTEWAGKLAPLLERQRARVTLRSPSLRSTGADEARRSAAETGLPWTVAVENAGMQAELDSFTGRKRLWLAGLGMLALLVGAGTWLIARAAMRELAVARLQSDFVSAVSHEFRTPLTSMRQITETLAAGRVASDERRQAYYGALERQTRRLHQLVESLLDFGRMEAGTSPYRLEPLDARGWVRPVVEQFGREVAVSGYTVELEETGAAAFLSADREALSNALWNLLDNAVKYSPECHTVWVETRRENGHFSVHVRDRGLGIPLPEQPEIFRKFVRGDAAKALGIRGTGIGLAMVDRIARAHGGHVRVFSETGTGSTFTLELPCHES